MRISVSGATVRFGSRSVLDALDLFVGATELVAIMGPSGSGKSTLLAVIAGQQALHQGVAIAGGGRRDIDWLVQSTPLLTRRTAVANVALGPISAGRSHTDARRQAGDVLAILGLADLAHQRVSRLSGGERQRVAVARALARGCGVVLADEPTASLDSDSRRLVCEALVKVARGGASVIVATHDPVVASFADRVLVLRDGQLSSQS